MRDDARKDGDMTGAPERIWAWLFMAEKREEGIIDGGWCSEFDRKASEYVRADLYAASQAQVAASYEVAATSSEMSDFNYDDERRAWCYAQHKIRALTPTDAISALAKRDAEIRNKALDEAAAAIEPHQKADVKTGGVLDRGQQAILALKTEPTP